MRMVLAALGLFLAVASPAAAIDGGMPDGLRHPNVGALAYDADSVGPIPPVAFCTGSVISDHAFLTARHCIEPPLVPLPPVFEWVITLDPGPIQPGGFVPADFPACCRVSVPVARATGVVLHPGYTPGFVPGQDPTLGEHDVAVVLFPRGTFAGVKPVRIARGIHGRHVKLVGYGAELRDGALYAGGVRKKARAPIADLSGNWLRIVNRNDGRPGGGAACAGDSGSPQFLAGVQVSLLHDAPGCSGIAYAQRLDTPAEQRFLAPYLR